MYGGGDPSYSAGGGSAPPSAEKATSSRAVLAALRALQDKIARLEGERAEAVHSNDELRARMRDLEARLEARGAGPAAAAASPALREEHDRLRREARARDDVAREAERRAVEAEERLQAAEMRANAATARARQCEDALEEERRRPAAPASGDADAWKRKPFRRAETGSRRRRGWDVDMTGRGDSGGGDVDVARRRVAANAAGETLVFRGDESRRRRGRDVDVACRRVAATWIFRGDGSRRRRGCVDSPWRQATPRLHG